jgi:hypothetical protein
MIDCLLAAIVGLVTWTVAAEGAWGAAVVFLSVLFSGLLSMDLFEPVAGMLESAFGADWSGRVDIIALLGIFSLAVFGLRALADKLVPSFINVHGWVYDAGRWGFAVLTGYTTMAMLRFRGSSSASERSGRISSAWRRPTDNGSRSCNTSRRNRSRRPSPATSSTARSSRFPGTKRIRPTRTSLPSGRPS